MTGDTRIQAVIHEIVRRLVAEYAPQKIILFGSYAYGQPDEDSDIDLLIIKATQERFFERMDTLRRIVTGAHRRIPFEPIVLTPEEVVQRLKAGDQFVAEILRKGEILHAE
jgi:predicted nucleotidyltransferase